MASGIQRQQNIARGIVYMMGAGVAFPLMNAGAKYLSHGYPKVEVIWMRVVGQLLFMCLVFMPTRGRKLFATAHLPYQLLCSVTMLSATVLFFIGVAYVPLAEAQAITFTGPLMVALLATPLLHEQVTLRRWAAIIVGFVGAVIVVRPGSEIANFGALLVFLNTVFYALYQIMTRILGSYDRPETTVTYSALVGTLLLSAAVPFVWKPPEDLLHAGVMLSLGFLGGFGHYCVTRALSVAPASIMSPFNYAQLLGAAILGFVVFDAVPVASTWIGSAIIIVSGLYMVYGATQRANPKPAVPVSSPQS